jgi:hypothetical protein
MAGSFAERTRELEARVGDGPVRVRVGFSPGRIAGPQHLGGWITGPLAGVRIKNYTTPGTGPRYLEDVLLENFERWYREVAMLVVERGGRDAMEFVGHDFLRLSQRRIPRRTGHLAGTGNMLVSEGPT